MTQQKNVIEQTNNDKPIEFTLQLSPEQYETYELLAKLNNQDLMSYVHECINSYLRGSIDYIAEKKTKKLAEVAIQSWGSAMCIDQTIILRGSYEASTAEMKVIAAIAKGQGYASLSELLQRAVRGGAHADMDHLAIFEGGRDMKETL